MRVFLWEYCCTATWLALLESLRREGRVMLSAVAADFACYRGIEVQTLPDGLTEAAEAASFRRLCRLCDWTFVIAPESDGILLARCRLVEEEGGCLLGPNARAVRLTGDKWELGNHLLRHGVPTPRGVVLGAGETPSLPYPLVCKPRDGAGSQATFLVRDCNELTHCVEAARAEGFAGELLVQPFVPGQPVSVAFLIGPRGRVALPAAEQHLSHDGRFRYHGGRLPLAPELNERAQRLAERAIRCVEGLRGYVGVDLVLGATPADDAVIEINPRLTTSYVGFRALTPDNLAATLLTVAAGEAVPALRWRAGSVTFTAAGAVFEER